MYPYRYTLVDDLSKVKEPVFLSTKLINSIDNLQAMNYEYLEKKIVASEESKKEFIKNYNSSFYELYKSFEYNIGNAKFDVPVAVAARTLYAAAYFNNANAKENPFKQFEFSDIKIETLNFILDKFIQKIQYADAESISQVMQTLTYFNYYNVEIWNKLISELKPKSFEPEYTKVRSSFPLFFRYQEVKMSSLDSIYLGPQGNDLFIHGFKSVVEAYNSLLKASYNESKIDSAEICKNLEERFNNLKDNQVKIA